MDAAVFLDDKAQQIHDLTERFHAANPRVVNGRDGDMIELLVDALPGATLFDLGGLQEALQDLLGVRVGLLTPGDLPSDLRIRVLASARPV